MTNNETVTAVRDLIGKTEELASEASECIESWQRLAGRFAVNFYIAEMTNHAKSTDRIWHLGMKLLSRGKLKEPTEQLQVTNKFIKQHADQEDKNRLKEFLDDDYSAYFSDTP